MKKIIAAYAVFAVTLALAPAASAAPRDDRLFYSLVTSDAPTLRGIPRKDLVKTAKTTCKYLRSGWTIMDAYELMEENGFYDDEISAFLAGAVTFYCPDQSENF